MKGKESIDYWFNEQYDVGAPVIIEALEKSPSAQGYIHGAVSEILLVEYLKEQGFEVKRIKEKPAGGFENKKIGYKGDFLIKKKGTEVYYVVECKGLKTNAEFRGAKTGEDHIKKLTRKQAKAFLKRYINIDKEKIYERGHKQYLVEKEKWEKINEGKEFPEFRWSRDYPGSDSVSLDGCFSSPKEIEKYVDDCDESKLSEEAFRKGKGLYKVLQTHQPSKRKDPETGKKNTAPLITDFSRV